MQRSDSDESPARADATVDRDRRASRRTDRTLEGDLTLTLAGAGDRADRGRGADGQHEWFAGGDLVDLVAVHVADDPIE
jgi:hypothetical protein